MAALFIILKVSMIINTSPRTTPEDGCRAPPPKPNSTPPTAFIAARDAPQTMVDSPLYNTGSAYYRSGSSRGFCERHLEHLSRHPGSACQAICPICG